MNNHIISMKSRNEYLHNIIQPDYLRARTNKDKKKQNQLLDDAQKSTVLNRKCLLEKLNPNSNLDTKAKQRKKKDTKDKKHPHVHPLGVRGEDVRREKR